MPENGEHLPQIENPLANLDIDGMLALLEAGVFAPSVGNKEGYKKMLGGIKERLKSVEELIRLCQTKPLDPGSRTLYLSSIEVLADLLDPKQFERVLGPAAEIGGNEYIASRMQKICSTLDMIESTVKAITDT